MHYFDRHRLPESVEKELNLTFHDSVESMVGVCDVVTINCPLHPETENLFDDDQQNDLYEYFIDAEDDNLSSVIDEFGDEFDEDDLRIYRIMFLSKVAN